MGTKKVLNCFGRFGERECVWILCHDEKLCRDCYWKWYLKRKKMWINMDEEIYKFMKNKKLRYKRKGE